MEPIGDLQVLRPILQSLKEKGLVRELTPEGRGQLVTHNLYKDRELAELQSRVQQVEGAPRDHSPVATSPSGVTLDMFHELQLEVVELRAEVSRLRGIVQEWESKVPR
jgi:hypothetical protein